MIDRLTDDLYKL